MMHRDSGAGYKAIYTWSFTVHSSHQSLGPQMPSMILITSDYSSGWLLSSASTVAVWTALCGPSFTHSDDTCQSVMVRGIWVKLVRGDLCQNARKNHTGWYQRKNPPTICEFFQRFTILSSRFRIRRISWHFFFQVSIDCHVCDT